jgi:hypothetical protein
MGQFQYSKEELDINKVLKMNLDASSDLLNDPTMKAIRNQSDENITSSQKLLCSLNKKKEVDDLSKKIKEKTRKLEHSPKLESWEEIVEQAHSKYTDVVEIEDFMTPDEIQSVFDELDEINEKFSKKTSIGNKTDLAVLTVAIALQVTKALLFPYIANKFEYGKSFDPKDRLDHNDKSIKKAHREANDKYRDKKLKKNDAGKWIEILYQTVPYDITKGSAKQGIHMEGRYHRLHTLGHDPILGWIFGTANILTDCITFDNLQTNRIIRHDTKTHTKNMKITHEIVPLSKMFQESYDITMENKLNLAAAIFAQSQHLKSDKNTKLGLPVPVLEVFNKELASKLYRENYDALCFSRDVKIVGTSAAVSRFFDMIIAFVHGLYKKPDEDVDLYKVRTRKILLISNSIASTSSIINAAITKNPKSLDIGGLLNTVSHLFLDIRFITKIKQEFVENEISERLQKELDEIDQLYDSM